MRLGDVLENDDSTKSNTYALSRTMHRRCAVYVECSELLSLYNLDAYPNLITLLPLMGMDTDLAETIVAGTECRFDGFQLHTKSRSSVTVDAAARGYLNSHKKG